MTSTTEDAHWAPPRLVVAKRLLSHVGHLQVTWDAQPDGAAARVELDRPLPTSPAVFALVEVGCVRYVGVTDHLARTFGPRGIGRVAAKDLTDPRRAEDVRLHRLVLASAAQRRVVDVYLLGEPERPRPWWRRREATAPDPDLLAEAARLTAATHGLWQRG